MRLASGLQILTVASVALFTATCGETPMSPPDVGNTTHTLLTDSPFPYDRVSRVDLYVVSVSASLAADTRKTRGG